MQNFQPPVTTWKFLDQICTFSEWISHRKIDMKSPSRGKGLMGEDRPCPCRTLRLENPLRGVPGERAAVFLTSDIHLSIACGRLSPVLINPHEWKEMGFTDFIYESLFLPVSPLPPSSFPRSQVWWQTGLLNGRRVCMGVSHERPTWERSRGIGWSNWSTSRCGERGPQKCMHLFKVTGSVTPGH